MKDKILIFAIGLLVGAIISTGAFYVYIKATNSNNNSNQTMEMRGGNPPEMPDGQNNMNGQPPEMPGGSTTQNNNI